MLYGCIDQVLYSIELYHLSNKHLLIFKPVLRKSIFKRNKTKLMVIRCNFVHHRRPLQKRDATHFLLF